MTDTGPRVQLQPTTDLGLIANISRNMLMNDVVPLTKWADMYPMVPVSQLGMLWTSVRKVERAKKLTKRIRECIAKYKARPPLVTASWTTVW